MASINEKEPINEKEFVEDMAVIKSKEPIKNMELITSVHLSSKVVNDNGYPIYYFVYASQLYQTLFAVYAQFIGEETTVGGEGAFAVQKISMKLINYKGILNMGFIDEPEWVPEKKVLNFQVTGNTTDVNREYDFGKSPLIVNVGVPYKLVFNRTLRPLSGFEQFLDNQSGIINSIEPPLTPLFDSEFNERDGVDFYKSEPKPGRVDYKGTQEEYLEMIPPFVGIRCNTSNVNLHF
jgi:hypothetical protein